MWPAISASVSQSLGSRAVATVARRARASVVAASMAAFAAAAAALPSAQAPAQTRAVYISALDASDAPAADLAAADLSIKEDDRAQPIVSLAPATARMSLAILIDDGGMGIDQFRLGLARLMNPLLGAAEFSLVGLAGQNQTLMEFTDRNDTLVAAVRGLRPRTGRTEQHVIQAVLDALTVEEKREAARPVVVVLTNQSREAGNGSAQAVMDRLARTGAVMHVIEVMQPTLMGGAGSSSGSASSFARDNDAAEVDRARSQVLGDGPEASGGRRQQLVDPAGAPAAMTSIAKDLAGQYVLVFQSTAKAGVPSKISVATTRPGIKIHAPARASGRPVR